MESGPDIFVTFQRHQTQCSRVFNNSIFGTNSGTIKWKQHRCLVGLFVTISKKHCKTLWWIALVIQSGCTGSLLCQVCGPKCVHVTVSWTSERMRWTCLASHTWPFSTTWADAALLQALCGRCQIVTIPERDTTTSSPHTSLIFYFTYLYLALYPLLCFFLSLNLLNRCSRSRSHLIRVQQLHFICFDTLLTTSSLSKCWQMSAAYMRICTEISF